MKKRVFQLLIVQVYLILGSFGLFAAETNAVSADGSHNNFLTQAFEEKATLTNVFSESIEHQHFFEDDKGTEQEPFEHVVAEDDDEEEESWIKFQKYGPLESETLFVHSNSICYFNSKNERPSENFLVVRLLDKRYLLISVFRI